MSIDPLQEIKARYADQLSELIKQLVGERCSDQVIGEKVVQFLLDIEQTQVLEVSQYLWKMVLEDRSSRRATLTAAVWSHIRDRGGVLPTSLGILVGKNDSMIHVLSTDDQYSVEANGLPDSYLARMQRSIGPIYLGKDVGSDSNRERNRGDAVVAETINAAISAISREEAFIASRKHTDAAIKSLKKAEDKSYQIPLTWVVDKVLALLCQDWFDVPDGDDIKIGGQPYRTGDYAMHCPYHYAMPSRYFFSPLPNEYEMKVGIGAGRLLQQQTKAFFQKVNSGERELSGPISRLVYDTLKSNPDQMASTLVGVMMGFLPTVTGNMLEIFQHWLDTSDPLKPSPFWTMQRQYCATFLTGKSKAEMEKADFLESYLTSAMQQNPIPEMIWRVAQQDLSDQESGLGCPVGAGNKVILGVMSAVHDINGTNPEITKKDVYPVFGGMRDAAGGPVHACPGYEAAMGVMLGMVAGLLEAGLASNGCGARILQVTHLPLVLELSPVISSSPSTHPGSPP